MFETNPITQFVGNKFNGLFKNLSQVGEKQFLRDSKTADLFNVALELINEGDTEKAVRIARSVVNRFPNEVKPRLLLAFTFFKDEQYLASVANLEKLHCMLLYDPVANKESIEFIYDLRESLDRFNSTLRYVH